MRDLLEAMVIVLTLFAIVIMAILGIAWGAGHYQCSNYQSITGTKTKYIALDSCYIHTADGWQRWDEYKSRAIASEGLKVAK